MEGRRCVIASMTILAAIAICGCTILPSMDMNSVPDGEEGMVREFEWKYKGRTYTWKIPIPEDLYQRYKSLPRTSDYGQYVKDRLDDEYLGLLCKKLSETPAKTDWSGSIDFVLSFVQSLKYADDKAIGFDEYPRYPIETLVDEGGDCEDTAILFVSIVREMGYGVVLLRFDQAHHMAAGVRISQDVVAGWNRDYALTYYVSEGKLYAYCETTGEGWRIGEKPEWVKDAGAVVIRV